MWIDHDGGIEGDEGYLVEIVNTSTGRTRFALRDRPPRTNQSLEPRLDGWCGETDNRSLFARGAWCIMRTNAVGDRAEIKRMTGASLAAFLERDGYPELMQSEKP